jgi:hypothetical protein
MRLGFTPTGAPMTRTLMATQRASLATSGDLPDCPHFPSSRIMSQISICTSTTPRPRHVGDESCRTGHSAATVREFGELVRSLARSLSRLGMSCWHVATAVAALRSESWRPAMRALPRKELGRSARSSRTHGVDATRGESGRQTRASHVNSPRGGAASSNGSRVGSACAGSRLVTSREAETDPSCGPQLRSRPPPPPSAHHRPSVVFLCHARSQVRHMSRWPADRAQC